jgi:hypothetical protein
MPQRADHSANDSVPVAHPGVHPVAHPVAWSGDRASAPRITMMAIPALAMVCLGLGVAAEWLT